VTLLPNAAGSHDGGVGLTVAKQRQTQRMAPATLFACLIARQSGMQHPTLDVFYLPTSSLQIQLFSTQMQN
jgi:hypothetical protein